jgi:hypothetical protein
MAFALATTTTAAPTNPPCGPACVTAQNLIAIAPETTTCASAPFPAECAPADIAAPNIAASFHRFHITSFGAQAALVALMLFETADFRYKINHSPGVPGQGTRNMQSPAFNAQYAAWIAATGADPAVTDASVAAAKAQGPAALLDLVNDDRWGFASAAWFLSEKCDKGVAEALADGQQGSFEKYLTGCVGTTVTQDRIDGWKKVVALRQW